MGGLIAILVFFCIGAVIVVSILLIGLLLPATMEASDWLRDKVREKLGVKK